MYSVLRTPYHKPRWRTFFASSLTLMQPALSQLLFYRQLCLVDRPVGLPACLPACLTYCLPTLVGTQHQQPCYGNTGVLGELGSYYCH